VRVGFGEGKKKEKREKRGKRGKVRWGRGGEDTEVYTCMKVVIVKGS
jgi:hypothetical protein